MISAQGTLVGSFFPNAVQFNQTMFMLNNRIQQVADPTAAGDALNLRTGDLRYAPIAAAGASVTVGDTPPASPTPGALWWDSVQGQLYIQYVDPSSSAAWVIANQGAISPAVPTSGGGGPPFMGVTDGSDAGPGEIGEVLVVDFPQAARPVNTQVTIATMTLPPGDWQCEAIISFASPPGVLASRMAYISLDGDTDIYRYVYWASTAFAVPPPEPYPWAFTTTFIPIPARRINTATGGALSIVFYVNAVDRSDGNTQVGGNVFVSGSLSARRMR